MGSRAKEFSLRFLIASAIYIIMFALPQNNIYMAEIHPVLPFWVLMSLGSYALFMVGKDVHSIRDCPQAHTELMGDIQSCKEELAKHGF